MPLFHAYIYIEDSLPIVGLSMKIFPQHWPQFLRNRSERDRRAVHVLLTPSGRRALSERHEWLRMREQALFGLLSARERALAPRLLRRLATLVEELAAGPSPDG